MELVFYSTDGAGSPLPVAPQRNPKCRTTGLWELVCTFMCPSHSNWIKWVTAVIFEHVQRVELAGCTDRLVIVNTMWWVSNCETTSTYNELKYLLKRSLAKPRHSYEQQLTFPWTFFIFKICHMTYKSRTGNEKTKPKKDMCNQWQTFPSEVVLFVDGRSLQRSLPLFCS